MATVDRMTGRALYGTTQTWDPTHTLHLGTNHLPAVDDATDGFWRRVALVPWVVKFRKPGEKGDAPAEDPGLIEALADEAPGILAWAVRWASVHAAGRPLHPFPAAVWRGRKPTGTTRTSWPRSSRSGLSTIQQPRCPSGSCTRPTRRGARRRESPPSIGLARSSSPAPSPSAGMEWRSDPTSAIASCSQGRG